MQRTGPLTVTLALAAFAHAQEQEPISQAQSMAMSCMQPASRQEMDGLQLGSGHVRHALRTLSRSLEWHDDLQYAAEAAEASGKLILWIQALGDLKGFA